VLRLTIRDLNFRATRFAVVTVGVALVLTLLYLMTGLIEQFNKEPFLTTDQLGATHWVIPEGVSGPYTSSSALSQEQVSAVEASGQSAEVVVARGTLTVDGEETEAIVIAGDPAGLGTPEPVEGSRPAASGEVVVDVSSGAAVGDQVLLGDDTYTVVGLSADTTVLAGLVGTFVSIDDARTTVFGGTPVTSAVLLDAEPVSTPEQTQVVTTADAAEDALGPLESAVASIDLIRVLLWVVAAIIIGAVIYLSALERTRDFAVLKAMGARNRQLSGSLALQAVLVSLTAAAVATVLQLLLVPVFPLTVRVPVSAYWQIPLVAAVVALVAGWAGMRRVRKADPALAFGGAA
jgi:putative ABC transport system permease protein